MNNPIYKLNNQNPSDISVPKNIDTKEVSIDDLIEYWLDRRNRYRNSLKHGIGDAHSIRQLLDKIEGKLNRLHKINK